MLFRSLDQVKKTKPFSEERVDAIDRNDESAVDDVERILQLRMMA